MGWRRPRSRHTSSPIIDEGKAMGPKLLKRSEAEGASVMLRRNDIEPCSTEFRFEEFRVSADAGWQKRRFCFNRVPDKNSS